MPVITRFPPSPTGLFHIGSARTALFNYLFAKHAGGTMMLRFEDTDRERSKEEYEDDIVEGLRWLGIEYELPEHPRQSERKHVYQKYIPKLRASGAAYEAEEAKSGEGKVVRFKNPNTRVSFTDLIRGDLSFDTAELGDFVIAKNVEEPLYHLAVVIDDYEMQVSHVIRGEDHLSNTQRQILILEALGFPRPLYAHIPLILASDRSKLSKRHGATSVNEYRAQGFLPEAFFNYLAFLGWHPGGEKELYSKEELIQAFDTTHVQKGGAIFDMEKFRWFNREYLLRLSDSEFAEGTQKALKEAASARGLEWNEGVAAALAPVLRERIHVWGDIRTLAEQGDIDYFFTDPHVDPASLPGKNSTVEAAAKHLEEIQNILSKISVEDFTHPNVIKEAVWEYATKEGRGPVLWPFRYSLTGQKQSPDPFAVSAIIGKESSLKRIAAAITRLQTS